MANLLDKASILLTPTAYDNGSMLSIKPTNGDGDFTFSRNSAATRVNAQGLVENVQILSGDLVQNGSFSQIGAEEVSNGSFSEEGAELVTNGNFDTDSNWAKGGGATISDGKANIVGDGTAFTNISQGGVFTSGKQYIVELDVIINSGLGLKFQDGANNENIGFATTSGTYTFYFTATANSTISIGRRTGGTAFDSSIDNCSVREVGQDWTLGTGWSIGDDVAIGSSTTNTLQQLGILQSNKTYKLTYTILDYVSGSIRPNVGTVAGTLQSSNGTFTEYITSLGSHFYFDGVSAFTGSITNISVKEVGQNWTFGDGFTPDQANSKATCDGTQSAATNLTQTISTNIQNKLVRVSFTLDYTAGVLLGSLSGTGAVDFNNITSSGTYTAEMTSNEVNPPLILQGDANFIGSITNIVIKEVTNDTDLPRINYEGFSYQDALGSEQVVNGTFDDGSTDWTLGTGWSISNGKLIANNAVGYTFQGGVFASGVSKTYKINLTVSDYVSGYFTILTSGGTAQSQQFSANGNYSIYFDTNSPTGTTFHFTYFGSFIGSIDNVSVKEYLGQEVVPDSGCGSYILEDESTNLIEQSELFSDAYWTKSGASVVSGFVSPSGDTNAFKLVEDNGSSGHILFKNNINTGSGKSTISIKAKADSRNWIFIYDTEQVEGCFFDLSNGTVGTVIGSPDAYSITALSNGWYDINLTTTSTTRVDFQVYLAIADNNFNYQGDGVSGLYIWGAQLEFLSYATSYIPTSGASSTRLRDLASGSGNSTLINSTEGTLYFEGSVLANTSTFEVISLSDGSLSNILGLVYRNVLNQFSAVVKSGGSTSLSKTITLADATDTIKVAVSYKLNDFRFYLNGVLIIADTSGNTPIGLNTLHFADGNGTSNKFYGKTKALAVFPYLTDAELTLLTTI